MLRVIAALSIACVFVALGSGCSGGPKTAKMAPVKGTVNLDGKPMGDGEIMFVVPGLGATTLEVKNGSFSGKAGVGDCKVEIRAYREGGEVVEMGGEKFGGGKENYIPPKYNTLSELKASIKEGGANEFSFDVTSTE